METNNSLGRTRIRSTRSRDGFSLIEVMVAMLVLGFGLLTIASAQIYAVKGGQFARHRTQAVSIAQSQMEQLKSMRWTQIAPTGWTAGVNIATAVEAPTNQIEQNYTVQWRIADVLANQTRNLDVRVAWTESNGNTKNYTVSSTRFNYEGL